MNMSMSTQHHNHHHLVLALFISISLFATLPSVSARITPNPSSIPEKLSSHASLGAWDSYLNFIGSRHGQTYEGLSKLKDYFHRFGYIPDAPPPPSKFTDDFDDALEAAVRTYQKNFNLKVTGVLDDATLGQIVRPRCGVPDIIKGTTGMKTSKPNGNITYKLYSYFPGMPRWPPGTTQLTYAFDPRNNLNDVVKGVFARAFARWSEVITITFSETTSLSTANIKVGFYTLDHGDGVPFDGALGMLAHSFAPTDGRFHLDGAEYWVASGDVTKSPVSTAVDMESVAVHEIGHLLGLGHSSLREAIMYPTLPTRTRKVELTEDDIVGVQRLYGLQP